MSATLITTSTVQVPTLMAANIDYHLSVYGQASPVLVKDGSQLAQVGDRSGHPQNYSWGDNQLRLQDQQRQRVEEERQFYYFYPERQTIGNNNNSCQGKDCNLRTFGINFAPRITPRIIRK